MFDKKMAMFYILDILREYSDKNHLLTQKDIINKLNEIYCIDMERKTISINLDLLTDYGYDIIKEPGKGYYLNEREFNENEIKYLIDAVYSSKSISGDQAKHLTQKLYSGLSRYEKKDYSYLYKSTEINRTKNEQIFLNIELINEAIKNKKKISFTYLSYDKNGKLSERRDGKRYYVSPYFLINNFNKYYLVCGSDYTDYHFNYRIEYMKDINILQYDIKPYEEVKTLGPAFDITTHINDHIYMFVGNVINSKIEILDEKNITDVVDWFGKNAKIYEENGKIYANIKSNDNAFYFWALQYQDLIKVLSPDTIVHRIVSTLEENIKKYKK